MIKVSNKTKIEITERRTMSILCPISLFLHKEAQFEADDNIASHNGGISSGDMSFTRDLPAMCADYSLKQTASYQTFSVVPFFNTHKVVKLRVKLTVLY